MTSAASVQILDTPKEKTLRELAQDALQVQDACNLSGVLLSWHHACVDLRQALKSLGQPCSTADVNHHVIMKLWADKVASLTETQVWTPTEISEAWDTVTRIAEGRY